MSNQPSLAYRQHHDVEAPRVDERAFRQGWRVVSRLDGLLLAGAITRDVWQSAVEYRDAWDALRRTSAGGGSSLRDGSGAGSGRPGALDRAARVRRAEVAIGPAATALVRACAVEDLSWLALGLRLGLRNVTVRQHTIVALRALARAWRRGPTRPGTGVDSGEPGGAVLPPARRPQSGRRIPESVFGS